MRYRLLGKTDLKVSAIGLGCMGMNHSYGLPDEKGAIATMEKALEIGINFWDTADIYANGENEKLVAKVLKPKRQKIIIATKFGFIPNSEGKYVAINGSPQYVKLAVENSLQRLQTDVIDLYYLHRIDPKVPIEETVGAMANLIKEGKIKAIGLSEISAQSLRKAHKEYPIAALQSEYSILTREVEAEILPTCRELGVSFVPFSPLARGLMTSKLDLNAIAEGDFRKLLPRYQKEYQENNQKLVEDFAQLAQNKGCTPAQLALAWVLSRGENIIPIPGTKKVSYLNDNARAVAVEVTDLDIKYIDNILKRYPYTGERYNESNLKFVDI